MTLIVEDGTGVADANSYGATQELKDYLALRGNEALDLLTDPELEPLLVRATDYIELRWSSKFKGQVLDSDQDLSFPRTAFNGLPERLKRACFEYAVIANDGPLAPLLDQDDSGREVKSRSEDTAGVIKESTTYATTTPRAFKRYPVPDKLISPLLRQARGVIR